MIGTRHIDWCSIGERMLHRPAVAGDPLGGDHQDSPLRLPADAPEQRWGLRTGRDNDRRLERSARWRDIGWSRQVREPQPALSRGLAGLRDSAVTGAHRRSGATYVKSATSDWFARATWN